MDPRSLAGYSRPKITAVVVEYDKNGRRERKTFADSHTARAFYAAKLKAGKNPRVVSAFV